MQTTGNSTATRLALAFAGALVAGCETEPAFVYVLDGKQAIELIASATPAKVAVGADAILHATRRTKGSWKRIASRERAADECWMARVPPEDEPEVADNLRWTVVPDGAAQFNTDFRADHTRRVVFARSGVYVLTATTAIACEPGRTVAAAPIRIEVVGR